MEGVNYLLNSHKVTLNIILKLKRIIYAISNMHSSLLLSDAFETIIDEACKILECERASVFLIDPRKNELWTKKVKGTKTIRIPIDSGFVGYVVQT